MAVQNNSAGGVSNGGSPGGDKKNKVVDKKRSKKASRRRSEIGASRKASEARYYLKKRTKKKLSNPKTWKSRVYSELIELINSLPEKPGGKMNEAWKEVENYRSAKYMELKGLIGSKRGDRIKGMHEVKMILNRSGYMDSYNPRDDDNDNFDEKLEKAIHVYHHYNHGKGNGIIDSATLERLTDDRPRCAFEENVHDMHKKLRMGYYGNGNNPSQKLIQRYNMDILRTNARRKYSD